MHSAAFDLSGASKGNRMCPWGAPSSISRNSPPLLAALLLNSRRRRRSLPFFSFRPFPSRFPSVLADSVVGESRLASSERSNIGPGRCSPSSLSLSSSARRLVVRPSFSPTRPATLFLSLFHPLASPLLSSLLFLTLSRHSSGLLLLLLRSSSIHPPLPPCPSSLPALFSFSRSYPYLLAIIFFHWPSLPRHGNTEMTVEEGRRAKKERVPFLSHFSLRCSG